jgi:ATP-dependent Clp protease ATP-binding subunit ClpB
MFKPLTKDNIGNIVGLIVDDLNKRLADREISVRLTPAARQFVIDNAYDPIYGARPLKRFVQKYVETLSAKLILEDRVAPHDIIEFDVRDGELVASAVKG